MANKKYYKKENKKREKQNLVEITGQREELAEFHKKILNCNCFVTNTLGYLGDKRLITEIEIPDTNYYIKHAWVKENNLPLDKVSHGYKTVKFKVIKYFDNIKKLDKYGLQIAEKTFKRNNDKMVIPKWKLELDEDKEYKQSDTVDNKLKHPFGKIRKIK